LVSDAGCALTSGRAVLQAQQQNRADNDMRRVVITGLGLVTPLASGVEAGWSRLLAGKSGARRVEEFDVSDISSQIACFVPRGDGSDGTFNPDDWMEPKEQRKVDDFIIYAMAAAEQALRDSGYEAKTAEQQERSGVLIGSGIGGLNGIAETSLLLAEKGPRRVSPFFIPGRLINLASGQVSIRHQLKGPNHAVVTACSTGAHAIGDAARLVALGDADVMVAGGAESPICRIAMAGFAACRALTTHFNDQPTKASRPYDKDRDGFIMGEGAGIVVLETLEHAKARGARIYGEIVGYGLSGDAYHITAPAEDGDGAFRCMRAALKRAGIDASEIDYVNAHGTSTPMGDEIELGAVERLFGNSAGKLAMSSTKSAIGHLLGAAGAVEAIYSVLAIRDNVAPPTLNLDNPSVETAIDLVPHTARQKTIDTVLSNSFGFGGTNASLVIRRLSN
jgi:3-oxoacyl-[acyl-carrier-protein] synthase II